MESRVSVTSFTSGVCDGFKVLDIQWDVLVEGLKLLHRIFVGVLCLHTKGILGEKLLGNMVSSWHCR